MLTTAKRSTLLFAASVVATLLPSLACAPAALPHPSAVTPAAPDPVAILRASAERYRTLATYRDSGTAASDVRPDDGSRPSHTERTFRTAFDRATGGLYFEMTKVAAGGAPVKYVLRRTAEGPLVLWSSTDNKLESLDPETGLYALRGVSASTSYDVPGRLLGVRMDDPHYVVDGVEAVKGARCYRLVARDGDRTDVVWIGVEDHAIHRRFARSRIDPSAIIAKLAARSILTEDVRTRLLAEPPAVDETTVDYEPVNDGPIDPALFARRPGDPDR